MLVKILQWAKTLAENNHELFATPTLKEFLNNRFHKKDFNDNPGLLDSFARLDDFDIYASLKAWCDDKDVILSTLCRNMINRRLFHIEMQHERFEEGYINSIKQLVAKNYNISIEDAGYFVFTDKVENNAYNAKSDRINILFKDEKVRDIAEASDQLNISVLSQTVVKFFLCYPKEYKNLC